ncbi:MAG: SRPBCC family protein [Rhodocyclaceae bacterium]
MSNTSPNFDPQRDLLLERSIDIRPELVWQAWTVPEHIKHWFTPAPWQTVDCEIDLRPGGLFRTVMRSPEGKDFPNEGCFLEVVENRRLTFTDTLGPDFRPTTNPFFTATILIEAEGNGTRYSAWARHKDGGDKDRHEQMGFHTGWGTALDQLVAYMKSR